MYSTLAVIIIIQAIYLEENSTRKILKCVLLKTKKKK